MIEASFFSDAAKQQPRPRVLTTGTYEIILKDIRPATPRKFGTQQEAKKRVTFVFVLKDDPTVEIYKTVPVTLKPNTKLTELALQLGGGLVQLSEIINPLKISLFLSSKVGNTYKALITPNRDNTYSNIESLKLISKRGE